VNILGETGNDRGREIDYPEFRALITRDCLWLALLCGSPGGISWDAIADPREFDIISRLAGRIDWNTFRPAAPSVVVRVEDLNADLGKLAEWSWWSLEQGVPLEFVAIDAGPAAERETRLLKEAGFLGTASKVSPPWFPKSHLKVSSGFQGKYMLSEDGRVFLGYVRNVGDILPQNVRTRTPRDLEIRLSGLQGGNLEVWDLDERALAQTVAFRGSVSIKLGRKRHDFALIVAP
jgi:hypothetical protein